MSVQDLHVLPKFRDGWSYLYVEHCKIDKDAKAIAIHDAEGKVPVPCANLALLMLGPGVSITHAAVSVLGDHGCLVVWCGEQGVRFYACGMGETRSAGNFLHQARVWADEELRMQVIRRCYQFRFAEELDKGLTLQQIRGKEGIRVREAYAEASRETGVTWTGRNYSRNKWDYTDPINRALSAANSCLYGLCHAAIVSVGFSPALGFIHTGKMLSFVYDVADLYKTEISIPMAFRITGEDEGKGLERRVRMACRDRFAEVHLLRRIVPDIQDILMLPRRGKSGTVPFDDDAAAPGPLWDSSVGTVDGGCLYPLQETDAEKDHAGTDS